MPTDPIDNFHAEHERTIGDFLAALAAGRPSYPGRPIPPLTLTSGDELTPAQRERVRATFKKRIKT